MKRLSMVAVMVIGLTSLGWSSERYVNDDASNKLLHGVENAWNNTWGSSDGDPDASGSIPGFSETASDGNVTVKITFGTTTYSIDYGSLDFSPMDPMQDYKCEFALTVNKIEIAGGATVTVKTPNNTFEYDCDDVKAGIKNFMITGYATVSGSTITLTGVATDIDSSDYYYSLPCSSSALDAAMLAENPDGALPSSYKKMLGQKFRASGSRFNSVTKNKYMTTMKNKMTDLAQ